jgi:TM2 domain-containing membrane protein YozV
MKNGGLAAVLSFLWTGLGQIYNGQIFKGLVFMLIQAINYHTLGPLSFGLSILLFKIYGVVDAFLTAERLNRTWLD